MFQATTKEKETNREGMIFLNPEPSGKGVAPGRRRGHLKTHKGGGDGIVKLALKPQLQFKL